MLLEVRNVSKNFAQGGGWFSKKREEIRAVDDVSLELEEGKTLGLVGESGCGKSTLARCILRLLEPDQGEIRIENESILKISQAELRRKRRNFQIIFQDPYSSLNPRMTIHRILEEPLIIHGLGGYVQRQTRVAELLAAVGLQPEMGRRYPHEFSGGQRQRIGIARALALSPKLIVADEPVSALDVSVQAQILNLLQSLQEKQGLSYLLIAHDLKVVSHLSDRIAVMYLGRIVEEGPASALIHNPKHPYTQALLSAVPVIRGREEERQRQILKGDVPSPKNPPSGCAFHPRCPIAEDRCKIERPPLEEKAPQHRAACFLANRQR